MLKGASPGFGNASALKNVLKVTNPRAENINMNQIIRGIDFEVQPGNPGAIALYFHGAQGGVIQDITVRLAPDAFAGFGGELCCNLQSLSTKITLFSRHTLDWKLRHGMCRRRWGRHVAHQRCSAYTLTPPCLTKYTH